MKKRRSRCAAARNREQHYRTSPGRLPVDGYSFWVTAEFGNVLLRPLECKFLIQETGVEHAPGFEFRRGEETERTQLTGEF